ncbi:bestrophin-like domain [Celeribacter litoreus]|uniref:bestrophin-like domain n=1 Tax=Celeribacter litoreus TaxID=2876714 RepID=UPI001CCCA0C9|nr:hypothetical protein [Celeribacter litoreus]MCA0043081.1 hypothetical protein [Celeribacter litoreus]
MLQEIMNLPPLLAASIIVLSIVLLSLSSYGITRKLLGHGADSERRELAGSVIFRVSALHGLVLALVFAQEVVNLRDVTTVSSREAALVGDVFYDLKRYDAEGTLPIREDLASYTRHVLETEWGALADENTLHDPAWAEWESAYEAILDLEPETLRQESLRSIMLGGIRDVSMLRLEREEAARAGVNPLFLTAAIVGVVLTAAAYFTFEPTRLNILLLTIFSSYTGLIIFFIIAFANPYHSPGKAAPVSFELLYQGEVRELAERAR